jgi:hypothetical protein
LDQDRFGQTEIDNLHDSFAVAFPDQHQVRRFNIAMDQMFRFRRDQRGSHLLSDFQCKNTGKRSLSFHPLRDRFTVNKFHGVEITRAVFPKVKYRGHVPMPQFGGASRLPQKTASRSGIL